MASSLVITTTLPSGILTTVPSPKMRVSGSAVVDADVPPGGTSNATRPAPPGFGLFIDERTGRLVRLTIIGQVTVRVVQLRHAADARVLVQRIGNRPSTFEKCPIRSHLLQLNTCSERRWRPHRRSHSETGRSRRSAQVRPGCEARSAPRTVLGPLRLRARFTWRKLPITLAAGARTHSSGHSHFHAREHETPIDGNSGAYIPETVQVPLRTSDIRISQRRSYIPSDTLREFID